MYKLEKLVQISNHRNAVVSLIDALICASPSLDEQRAFDSLKSSLDQFNNKLEKIVAFERREDIRRSIACLEAKLNAEMNAIAIDNLQSACSKPESWNHHRLYPEPHCDLYHDLMEGEHQGG